MCFGRYRISPHMRQVLRDGEPLTLNGKAFELLLVFLESDGRVLTREDLYQRLWGERIVEDANLSQTIYLLRRTLDPDGDGRDLIETIPRIGYRFAKEARQIAPAPSARRGILLAAALSAGVLIAGIAWSLVRPNAAISIVARNGDELGEYHLAFRTPDHLSYALNYFKKAEAAAPDNAVAYAGAASAYALLAEFQSNGSAPQRALVSLANAAATAALRLDGRCARADAVLGFIAYRFHDNDALAAHDLASALAIDPGDAEAHLWHGVLLMREGSLAGATAEFQTAHQSEPTSEVYSRWLARAYTFEEKPDEAIAEALETLRIEPNDAPAMLMLAEAQEQRGRLKSALRTLEKLARIDPYEEPFVAPDEARLQLRLKKWNAARTARHFAVLAAAGRVDPFETALLYFTLHDKAEAMRMLHLTSPSSLLIQRYDPRLRTN